MATSDDLLLQQILDVENSWKVERGLAGLGRLLPGRAKRVQLDRAMIDDLMRDERGLAANAPAVAEAGLGKALDHYLRGESARRAVRGRRRKRR